MINNSHGKRMVSEKLIKILKEMDSKNISIGALAEVLESFADGDVQMKLTAGDNVQISEDNVISATDTTYTAGTGIEIENGVISALSAGGKDIYEHNIYTYWDGGEYGKYISKFTFLNNNPNPVNTGALIAEELYKDGYTSEQNSLLCSGSSSLYDGVAFGIYTTSNSVTGVYIKIQNKGVLTTVGSVSGIFNGTIVDSIRKVN